MKRVVGVVGVCGLLVLAGVLFAGRQPTQARWACRYFPETGHQVCGRFLAYWNQHGGLAQQGFPLTDELTEWNPTDRKTNTVQYFERAVFELHPENQPPYDVLLSLLGRIWYNNDYARLPPQNEQPSRTNARYFPETGKTLGGVFRDYWEQHDGLAQQGYPITNEFVGTGEGGKQYVMQYFERAVFEYHPENRPPYNVLLQRLGQKQRDTQHGGIACIGCGAAGGTPPTPEPPAGFQCSAGANRNGWADPPVLTTSVDNQQLRLSVIHMQGFTRGEGLRATLYTPTGVAVQEVSSPPRPNGEYDNYMFVFDGNELVMWIRAWPNWAGGVWRLHVTGDQSQNEADVSFCIYHRGTTRTWPVVQYGQSGSRVQMVQFLLRARGYSLTGTGNYLEVTRAAVRNFQGGAGLPTTGSVDGRTWEALVFSVREGDTGDAVRAVQERLLQMCGVDACITVTGGFDAKTLEAVQDLQRQEELPVDGVVDVNTWYDLARYQDTTDP
jgi:hypothetical protein